MLTQRKYFCYNCYAKWSYANLLKFHKNLNIDPMFQINRKSRYIENVEDLKNFISKVL